METNQETRVGYKTVSVLKDIVEEHIREFGPTTEYLLKWDQLDKYLKDMPYRGGYYAKTLERIYK